jgi:hypothetical protein
MPPITPYGRHLFSTALLRDHTDLALQPHHLEVVETNRQSVLPRSLLHTPRRHRSNPHLCVTHAKLNQKLLTSLASRLLHEAQLKLPLLTDALATLSSLTPSKSGLKPKHLDAVRRLHRAYSSVVAFFFPPGSGDGVSVGGCDGCFVAATIGSRECVFALVAGARVWRKDRSAVRAWVKEWVRLVCLRDIDEIKKLGTEAEYTGHAVRKVLRTLKRRAGAVEMEGSSPASNSSGVSAAYSDPFRDPSSDGSGSLQEEEGKRTGGVRYSLPGNPFWEPESGVPYAELPAEKGERGEQDWEDSENPPVVEFDREAMYRRHAEVRRGWDRYPGAVF